MASFDITLRSSKAWRGNIHLDATPYVSGNYSSIYIKATMWKTDGYLTSSNNKTSGTISIDGSSYTLTRYNEFKDEVTIYEGTHTIYHESDGSKSLTVSLTCTGQAGTSLADATLEGSKTLELDVIPRNVSITAAPNFTDEENPVMRYENEAGSGADSLRAAILSEDGSKTFAAYREIGKTDSAYTFALTTAERNAMRNAIPEDTSMRVQFSLVGTFGSTTLTASAVKEFTIVNANPSLTAAVKETNAAVAALTGDSTTMIRYVSSVQCTNTAAAKKGASLDSRSISCGSQVLNGESGIFEKIESGKFIFIAIDSRGNRTQKVINREIVEYVEPTVRMGSGTPDTSGNFTFSVSGKYFNGSFGAAANTISVEYRYKVGTGNYCAWTPMEPVLDGNTYTAKVEFKDFDYQTTYRFQARITDKIQTYTANAKNIQTTPVFDWSGEDIAFNVPVYLRKELYMDGLPLVPKFELAYGYEHRLPETWYGGNPIYGQIFNITLTGTYTSFLHGISNVSRVVDAMGYYSGGAMVPYEDENGNYVRLYADKTKIGIKTNFDATGKHVFVMIKYQKSATATIEEE